MAALANKPKCKYWDQCYRTNASHLSRFKHPADSENDESAPQSKKRKRRTPASSSAQFSDSDDEDEGEDEDEGDDEGGRSASSSDGCGESDEGGDSSRNNSSKRRKTKAVSISREEAKAKSPTKAKSSTKARSPPKASVAPMSDSDSDFDSDDEKDGSEFIFPRSEQTVPPAPNTDAMSAKERRAAWKKHLKAVYEMEMPEDLLDLAEFALELDPASNDMCKNFKRLCPNLRLVGPFEMLAGAFDSKTIESIHLHWRFYYDPPEFETVIVCDDSDTHYGYFRDDPRELPVCVASSGGHDDPALTPLGDTIFAALARLLDAEKGNGNVDKKARNAFEARASKLNYSVSKKDALKGFKARKKRVVCTTFHKMGAVVPVKDDYGYRELPQSDAELKRILKRMDRQKAAGQHVNGDELEQTLTYISYADDEGDPGMGFQLGLNLFSSFPMFQKEAVRLLTQAYKLLKRPLFKRIVCAHTNHRLRSQHDYLLNQLEYSG